MLRSMKIVSLGLLCLAMLAGSAPALGATGSLNARVLAFARGHMGRQIGNGQCWALADAALKAAGAHRPGAGGYGSYVFGRHITLASVRPGDILQFKNVTFKHTNPNGGWSSMSFPKHTAIVGGVNGRTITLLHQNVNGVMRVQLGTINLNDRLPGGSLNAYRPQPK